MDATLLDYYQGLRETPKPGLWFHLWNDHYINIKYIAGFDSTNIYWSHGGSQNINVEVYERLKKVIENKWVIG